MWASQHSKEDWEKSAGLHAMEKWRRIWPPALMINWDFFPLFPFKNCHGWADYPELVSGHKSIFSPHCRLSGIKHLSSLPKLVPQFIGCWVVSGQSYIQLYPQPHEQGVGQAVKCLSIWMNGKLYLSVVLTNSVLFWTPSEETSVIRETYIDPPL